MAEAPRKRWERVPLIGGALKERRRSRVAEAYRLVASGAAVDDAVEAAKLDADTAVRFTTLMKALQDAEQTLRALAAFAEGLPREMTEHLREATTAAGSACDQLGSALAQGRLDVEELSAILKTTLCVASDNGAKVKQRLERAESGRRLLAAADHESRVLSEMLEAEPMLGIEWLRALVAEKRASVGRLREQCESKGYTKVRLTEISDLLASIKAIDARRLITEKREALERVERVYLPAIAELERVLAPYGASEPGLEVEQFPVSSGGPEDSPSQEHPYSPFMVHEHSYLERLCALTLEARNLLGEDDVDQGRSWSVAELPELCVERARQACEEWNLPVEAQYLMGVEAAAEGWLASSEARGVEDAARVLEGFRDLDLAARSMRLGHFYEALEHEYLDRTRASYRRLIKQLTEAGQESLLVRAQEASAELEAIAKRAAARRACQFDIDLTLAVGRLADDLPREAAREAVAQRRREAMSAYLETKILPLTEWIRLRVKSTGDGGDDVIDAEELTSRYGAVAERAAALGSLKTASTEEDATTGWETEADSILAEVSRLKRDVECALLVDAEWKRCVARSERLLVPKRRPDMSDDEARRATEMLYRSRRGTQGVVLLGDTLVFPVEPRLEAGDWGKLNLKHLDSIPAPGHSVESEPYDSKERIHVLLTSWGYVVATMLWYEERGEAAALSRMREYRRGTGKKICTMDGKTLHLLPGKGPRSGVKAGARASRSTSKEQSADSEVGPRRATIKRLLDESISPGLDWVHRETRLEPTKEVYVARATGLKDRYLAASRRAAALRNLYEAAAARPDPKKLAQGEKEAFALETDVRALRRDVECIIAIDELWTRRKAAGHHVVDAVSAADWHGDEARRALDALYLARRYEQACVLLGDKLILPVEPRLTLKDWDALRLLHLGPSSSWDVGGKSRRYDARKRMPLLLSQWGFVVPAMLSYEARSESRALQQMESYVFGPGRGSSVFDGKVLRPSTPRATARRRQSGHAKGANASSSQKPSATKSRPVRELRPGDEVMHRIYGRCYVVRLPGPDRVELLLPNGEVKLFMTSKIPLARERHRGRVGPQEPSKTFT